MTEASLELAGLSRRFGSVVALDGLTFTAWMARTAAAIYRRSILRTGARVRLREVLARSSSA